MILKRLFRSNFIFLFIILCASLFRITNLDVIEFKIDEANNLFLASRPIFNHPFPYGGVVSSVGILNPPLFTYFLFTIAIFTLNPQTIAFVIALINIFMLGFFFWFIKNYYSKTLALICTIFLAFSPWSIIFSRKIWPPDLIPPLSIMLLYSLHKAVLAKKMIFWTAVAAFSMLLIQLDLSSAFFILLLAFFLILQRPKMSYFYLGLGIFIGIIPAIPYIIYELTNNCPDCLLFLNLERNLPINRSIEVFARPLQILNQGNFHFLLGDDAITFANEFPFIYRLRKFLYLEYLLIPLGIFLFWKKYQKLRFFTYSILALPFVYFVFRLQPAMHYFIIMVPLLSLFLGLCLLTFLNSKNKMVKYTFSFLLVILLVSSVTFDFAFFKFLGDKKGLKGDYGASLAIVQKENKEELKTYKYDKNYQEMLIANYIPLWIFHGTSPFAKMIYPYDKTKKNLTLLEKRLKVVPSDPRVIQELVAYYTTTNPTRSTIDLLRLKKLNIPGYKKIFNEVYHLYLATSFKKNYKSSIPPFFFEYPEHWEIIENYEENKVIIKEDTSSMTIKKSSFFENLTNPNNIYYSKDVNILGKTVQRVECYETTGKWCSIKFSPFQIDKYYYQIEYATEKSILKSKELNDTISAMDDIVDSFRIWTIYDRK